MTDPRVFTITLDSEAVERALTEAPEVLAKNLAPEMLRIGRFYQKELTKNQLSGQRGDTGLNRVTGNLARSVSYVVAGKTIEDMQLNLLIAAPYAAVHEFGGAIRFEGGPVRRHRVRSHMRSQGEGRRRVRVAEHERGPFERAGSTRFYKPRLGAVSTFEAILPFIAERAKAALDKTSKHIEGHADGTR